MDLRVVNAEINLALCEIEESMLKACELIGSINQIKDKLEKLCEETDNFISKPHNCS